VRKEKMSLSFSPSLSNARKKEEETSSSSGTRSWGGGESANIAIFVSGEEKERQKRLSLLSSKGGKRKRGRRKSGTSLKETRLCSTYKSRKKEKGGRRGPSYPRQKGEREGQTLLVLGGRSSKHPELALHSSEEGE